LKPICWSSRAAPLGGRSVAAVQLARLASDVIGEVMGEFE
jgi:hypothetical protein